MKNTSVEKHRIAWSRGGGVLLFLFLCATNSHWDENEGPVAFLLFLVGLVLIAIASLGRIWCSLYIAGYKDKKLVVVGPYSMCRNPLYFFSFLGGLGVGCATETFTFPLLLVAFFVLYYPFMIRSEEQRLRRFWGAAFDDYQSRVPRFFPKISLLDEPENYTVKPVIYRKHILSALWFIWLVGIIECIEGLKDMGWLHSWWTIY